MTHLKTFDTSRRLLTSLLISLGLLLAATALQARDVAANDYYFLSQSLAEEGVALEAVSSKIQPELLAKLEADAENAFLKGSEARADRSIIINLRVDRQRHVRMLAEKSGEGRAAIKQEVRATQDRVLRAVATKDRRGFELRNRYSLVAGFSARADYRAVAALALQQDVESIEEMMTFRTQALLDNNADETTDTRFAHDIATGQGVNIAIIDGGITPIHHLLGDEFYPNTKVIGGYDFADDDPYPTVPCLNDDHGTAVSFIAAGKGGVAPDATLLHLKVQSDSKCGKDTLDGDIPGAIDWIVDHQYSFDTKIISMSFGYSTYSTSCSTTGSTAYRAALDAAEAAGMLVVAASGNDADKNGMAFPACYPTVMSVGAVYDKDFNNTRKHYDGNGKLLCKDKKPDRYEVTCYSNSSQFIDVMGPADCAKSYCQKLCLGDESGGAFAIDEFHSSNDVRKVFGSVERAPSSLRRGREAEDHRKAGDTATAAFGSLLTVLDGGEC